MPERTLVVMCPDWPVVASFEPVVVAVESFTLGVEVVHPGLCAFATRGPSRYFGGDEKLAEAVAAAVDRVLAPITEEVPPPVRVGVADGRFAAERATREWGPAVTTVVVPRGDSRAFLAPQPVRSVCAGLPAGTAADDLVDLLVRLGIRTLGDLASLPPAAVLARFGSTGVSAQRLARGLDLRPLAARTPPDDLAVVAELDPPTDSVETAAFVARGLAERLHDNLAGRGLAATRVLVEAETEHGECLTRLWRLDHLSAAALAERVRWQLDGWLTNRDGVAPPTGPLSLLRLTPDEVGPGVGRQDGFWGGDRAAAERAARALARVQGVLGPEAVVTAEMVGGRGPAEQVRFVPWGDARTPTSPSPRPPRRSSRKVSTRQTQPPPWPGRMPAPAPATVHPFPLAAEVLDASGTPVVVDGRGIISARPTRLVRGATAAADIAAWAGPWPADERWWDPPVHRRRARCQIVTAEGEAYLVVVEAGRWWVEATYD